MEDQHKRPSKGVAALFDITEIKSFLKNYLVLIGIIEIFIFSACFISQLGPGEIPFPWKTYFFASFIIPVAVTFLLGIFVMGFNKYLFGETDSVNQSMELYPDTSEKNYLTKFQAFLNTIQQVPFLISLLILGIVSGIIYKIDEIVAFISRAGERTAQYLLVSLGIVLFAGATFAFVWMLLAYKLKKTAMQYKHQYRHEVAKQLGIIIMDDNTVIDQKGNVISNPVLTHNPDADFFPSLPENLIRKDDGESSQQH